MSDLRDKLKEIDQELDLIDEQKQKLDNQSFDLVVKRHAIVAKLILDETLLENTTWTIKTSSLSSYLEYNGGRTDIPAMKEISEIASVGFHSTFELSPGVRIQFDDNKVSLKFDDNKLVLAFATKHKLKVLGTNITDQLRKLQRQISGLEALCHIFNLK